MPGALEIARNFAGIEGPHSEIRVFSVDDQRLAPAGDANAKSSDRLAGKGGQRSRRFGEIAALVEDPAFEHERLIGADAVGVGRPR